MSEELTYEDRQKKKPCKDVMTKAFDQEKSHDSITAASTSMEWNVKAEKKCIQRYLVFINLYCESRKGSIEISQII